MSNPDIDAVIDDLMKHPVHFQQSREYLKSVILYYEAARRLRLQAAVEWMNDHAIALARADIEPESIAAALRAEHERTKRETAAQCAEIARLNKSAQVDMSIRFKFELDAKETTK